MRENGSPAPVPERPEEITKLLRLWGEAGDRDALDAVMPLVSGELRRIAGRLFAGERASHTLQPTALVSEAYVRLIGRRKGYWKDRLHFFSFAAREMRRILVDHARKHRAAKRGHGIEIVPLDKNDAGQLPRVDDILELDDALEKLAAIDERQARLTELRYFAGLSVDEIAAAEDLSRAAVYRDLAFARAWVKRTLS